MWGEPHRLTSPITGPVMEPEKLYQKSNSHPKPYNTRTVIMTKASIVVVGLLPLIMNSRTSGTTISVTLRSFVSVVRLGCSFCGGRPNGTADNLQVRHRMPRVGVSQRRCWAAGSAAFRTIGGASVWRAPGACGSPGSAPALSLKPGQPDGGQVWCS